MNDADAQDARGPDSDDQDLVVVYAARTATDAHQLRNLLVEAGIRATVTNSVLAGGAGVDVVGWATLARVAVAAEDADAARRAAREFVRRAAATLRDSGGDPVDEEPPSGLIPPPDERRMWPVCPGCGTRRATRCPICGTDGADFTQADPEFLGTPGVGDDATPMSCGCGSAGCSPGQSGAGESAPGCGTDCGPEKGGGDVSEAPPEPPTWMLICSTCSEPFVPEHARRCARCGHEFDQGYEVHAEPREEISARAVAVILGLVALVIAFVIYFAMLV